MAQTTIQGSFLGDGTVTGVKIGADFISAQTVLSSGLATADELIVSDGGVIKKMATSEPRHDLFTIQANRDAWNWHGLRHGSMVWHVVRNRNRRVHSRVRGLIWQFII